MKYYSIQNIILLAICAELDYIGMLIPSTGVLTTGTLTGDKLMCDLTDSEIVQKIDQHQHMKKYGWTFVSADKYQNDTVTVRQILLRQGLPTMPSGNTEPYPVSGALGWGAGEWGSEPWGGTGEVGARLRPQKANRAAGLQLLIEGHTWWRLKGLTIASRKRSDKVAA